MENQKCLQEQLFEARGVHASPHPCGGRRLPGAWGWAPHGFEQVTSQACVPWGTSKESHAPQQFTRRFLVCFGEGHGRAHTSGTAQPLQARVPEGGSCPWCPGPPGPFLSSPALPRARGPPDAMELPLKDGHSAPAPGLEPRSEETQLPCGVQSGAWRRAGSGDASPDSGYYGHAEWPGACVSWRPSPSSLVTQAPQ